MSFKPTFKIENQKVGIGQPVFIIAEIGVNHNGDWDLAKRTIDAAKACGVDCVKFQTFRAEEFLADPNQVYEYESGGKRVSERMYDMFKRLELPENRHTELFDYARHKGLIPLTSVADPQSAALVKKIGVGALKLSSEDFINLPLLEVVSKMKMPLLLSTGMALEEEMHDAKKLLSRSKVKEAIFLHCVSVYPTPDAEANLRRIESLAKVFKAPIGYSDHTYGIEACLAAVALGACVLEKHFTLDRNFPGPDHALSSNPEEMKRLVEAVRKIEIMKGNGDLNGSPSEKKSRIDFRRSIVASHDLQKGVILKREDLVLKRPGTGLRARDMKLLLGKKLKQDIKRNQLILKKSVR